MNDLDLARRLNRLRRTVLMLETDLRNEYLNKDLLAQIDSQLELGIATEPRSAALRDLVDELRESSLARSEKMYADAIRACEKLKDAIEGVVEKLG